MTMQLVPPRAPLPAPRGRPLTAAAIVAKYYTTADGERLVSTKWVKANLPGKVRLSHSKVVWYEDDVTAFVAQQYATRKAG